MIGVGTSTADYSVQRDIAAGDAERLLDLFTDAFQRMQYLVAREQAKISGLAIKRFLTVGAAEHGRSLFSKDAAEAVADAFEELADCLIYLAYAEFAEEQGK